MVNLSKGKENNHLGRTEEAEAQSFRIALPVGPNSE
jgi:hypothetical protein